MYNTGELPSGWQEYVHVDGKPYFYNGSRRIVTEECVRVEEFLTELEDFYAQVNAANLKLMKETQLNVSEDLELYLTLTPKRAYYYVDHVNKSIFWLEDLPIEQLGINQDSETIMSFGK